jgi:uroporphyrinogen decarboxylase
MTSTDCVRRALQGESTPWVPVVEFVIDSKIWRAAMPDALDCADFMDRAGYDGVGCGATFNRVDERDDGTYVDEWGVRYLPGPEAVAHPLEGPIATIEDARAWTPPDPDAAHRHAVLRDIVSRYKGRRAICFHHRAAFMWSAYLTGLDNLLLALLADTQLAEYVMDKVLEANLQVVRNAIRAGAEVIVLGDDYAHNHGPMMSPAVFAQFIAPRLARMVEMIHDEGALCIKHSDGNIYPILDAIVATGPDGLNPIEPVAGMTLSETRRRVGPRLCLVGNIDCGQLLCSGTPDEVRKAVQQAMEEGSAGGPFMLSSSNSIHSSCNPDNVLAMLDAAHAFNAR